MRVKSLQKWAFAALVVVIAGIALWGLMPDDDVAPSDELKSGALKSGEATSQSLEDKECQFLKSGRDAASPLSASPLEEDSSTDEESSPDEDPEEAKIETFEALTDVWMEPSKAGVTEKDIAGFVAAFHRIPKDRQDECVNRALNLIPDENVMLLAGLLLDKSLDKEIVETVFHDVLNRDESVKLPIMRQILMDKSHPCWEDANWIVDAQDPK